MARLTDEELQDVIDNGPDAIKALTESAIGQTEMERVYIALLKAVGNSMLEDVREIQALRQQNADMAAWINAQQEGV